MAFKQLFNHLIMASTGGAGPGGGGGGPATIEVDPITRSVVEKTTTTTSPATTTTTGDKQQTNSHKKATRAAKATDWQLDCKYTLSEIQQHNSLDDCWVVIFDKVYNITDFVFEHPGGDFILLEYAGRDATHPFLSSRHGSSAYKMLDKYWIGILVDEELYYSNNSSYCSVYSNLSWRSTPLDDEEEEDQEDDDDDSSSSSSATTTNTTTSTTSSSSSTSSNDSNNSTATTTTTDLDHQQLQLQYFRTLFSFDTT